MKKKKLIPIVLILVVLAVAGFFLLGDSGTLGTSRAYTASNFEQMNSDISWSVRFDKFNGYYEHSFTCQEDGYPYVFYFIKQGDIDNIVASVRTKDGGGELFDADDAFISLEIPPKKGDTVILRFECDNADYSVITFAWGKEVQEHYETNLS